MMSDIDKLVKIMAQISKDIVSLEQKRNKEMSDIKRMVKDINKKISEISGKIQEFEIIMDAAEFLEEQMEDRDDYNTEWNPYDDDDYEAEEYEQYGDDEDEEL